MHIQNYDENETAGMCIDHRSGNREWLGPFKSQIIDYMIDKLMF